jgi:tetratricopeptide (TPR) repeat protein
MLRRESKTTDLRSQLTKALHAGRVDDALSLYELIEIRKPNEPRWSHRKGDLLRRMGRKVDAVVAYERAVSLYAAQGFFERATATAKVMLAIDPSKGDVLARLDAESAHALKDRAAQLAPFQHRHPG